MKQLYLSKTDFKIALSCPTKLYYLKKGYPNTLEDDEFLDLMSEGGYMVAKMAQLMHPDGIEIKLDKGLSQAILDTQQALKKDRVTLFEPVFLHNNCLLRVDVLKKDGSNIELIEVKAKSMDGAAIGEDDNDKPWLGKKGGILSNWRSYFDDITFQYVILKDIYPDLNIVPCLMMPDKSKANQIEGLAGLFELISFKKSDNDFRTFEIAYHGNTEDFLTNSILAKIDVTGEVNDIFAETKASIQTLVSSLGSDISKIDTPLSKHCADCEFHCDKDGPKGFEECWGALAHVKPHFFDLYYAKSLGGNKTPYIEELVTQGKAGLYDVPDAMFKGERGKRQKLQVECTKASKPWVSDELKDILSSYKYPLHFIDFETSRMALPYHKGFKPYEQIAFQWSCHTITEEGAEPIHKDYINITDHFPNFAFAKHLMNHIGYDGTVFMWAKHEDIVLSDIKKQMARYNHNDPELAKWLEYITSKEGDKGKKEYTMIDMCSLTEKHFFLPAMKGSVSLKYVLPAVWQDSDYIKSLPFLNKFIKEEDGSLINPYKTLPEFDFDDDTSSCIREGTAAMKAYQDMMYGQYKNNPTRKEFLMQLLLDYCELDTMAMVVVWGFINQLGVTTEFGIIRTLSHKVAL